MFVGRKANETEDIEEKFSLSDKSKEISKAALDESAKEFADFMGSVSDDMPELSEEEINCGVEKILEKAYPAQETSKDGRAKKITLRVLFAAALISILSVSCIFVLGNSHNISIENGFVTFTKDTVKIVFFGEEEEYITVDALLSDLDSHGYGDILFPQEFVTNSDEYKASVPEYRNEALGEQVAFDIIGNELKYIFDLHKMDANQNEYDYVVINNAKTVVVNDVYVYIFEHDNNLIAAEFAKGKYRYLIKSTNEYSDMEKIIETIK